MLAEQFFFPSDALFYNSFTMLFILLQGVELEFKKRLLFSADIMANPCEICSPYNSIHLNKKRIFKIIAYSKL